MPDFFIGVISYSGTRFADSQGPDGLALSLAKAMAAAGVQTDVLINTDDLYSPELLTITREVSLASVTAQVNLDRKWANFLGIKKKSKWWRDHGLRWGKRLSLSANPPSPSSVQRLLNIELSHLQVMRASLDSGAEWILILEDDAAAADILDLTRGLTGIMESVPPPDYVNISRSFSPSRLGISHLMNPVAGQRWQGAPNRILFSASKPVTNTVCAILYHREFLSLLLTKLDELPLEPVVPIDWKLNVALMELFQEGAIRPGSCWVIEPAPVLQRSMT